MLTLTFEPIPTLTIDNEVITGINIINRLHQLMNTSKEAEELFLQAASIYQSTRLPQIGFRLKDERAIMPTKRIIDVGYDLTIVATHSKLTTLTTMFETFISLDIPLGYYVEIVPRSSLSKTGYMLANSIGIIDPSFTGTLKVALTKIDQSMPNLELPARVCQLIIKPYVVSKSYDASKKNEIQTLRGAGGFGSTG